MGKIRMEFSLTAINVLMFIALAIPGYIIMKVKLVKPSAIAYFAAVLLYVNQPFLSLYSFLKVEYSPQLLANLGVAFLVSLISQCVMFFVVWFILHKRYSLPNPCLSGKKWADKNSFLQTNADCYRNGGLRDRKGAALRVLTLSCTFGNVGFLGVPILYALLPLAPEAIAYSAVYIVSMNLLCWTVGAAVLTGDKKYISLKKALLNPPTATLIVALPLFFMGIKLPDIAMKGISFLAEMTTPMCMLILGMRFATAPMKQLFENRGVWMASLTKIIIFPLAVFGVLYFLPIDHILKVTMFILAAMPSASVTLNLSEIYKADTNTAANAVLLSTLLCALTVPVLLLLA
ncbi:MAG: AEC family transporter [Clostridia bacterium]|nr:AEC family transporter [Clostridia bacterium]